MTTPGRMRSGVIVSHDEIGLGDGFATLDIVRGHDDARAVDDGAVDGVGRESRRRGQERKCERDDPHQPCPMLAVCCSMSFAAVMTFEFIS